MRATTQPRSGRVCFLCGDALPDDRRDSYCKPCRTACSERWRADHIERSRESRRRYNQEHPHVVRAAQQRYEERKRSSATVAVQQEQEQQATRAGGGGTEAGQ